MKIKLRKPIDTIVLIIPSIENTLDNFSSVSIIEFDISISLEKQISVFKKFLPTSLMESEIKEFIFINCSHKKKLQFIQIPTIISFNINLYGFCDSTIAKLESIFFIAKYKINPIKSAFAINNIPLLEEEPKIFSR